MLKFAATAAVLAASLVVSLPGTAFALTQEEFEANCAAAGGQIENGSCVYPDGKVETCAFGEDQWGCFAYVPGEEEDFEPLPAIRTVFPEYVNIPKKVIKMPIPHGPVMETIGSSTSIKKAPSAKSPSVKATTTMTTVKAKPMTTTTLKIKKLGH